MTSERAVRVPSVRSTWYLQVQQAVGQHRQVGDAEPFGLQNSTRVQHTLVLRLRRDHVTLLGLVEPGHALQGRRGHGRGHTLSSVVLEVVTQLLKKLQFFAVKLKSFQ